MELDSALTRALGHAVMSGWASSPARCRERARRSAERHSLGTSLVRCREPPELVGCGGFKGAPHPKTASSSSVARSPSRRGRGLAIAAVRAMVADAFADDCVSAVIADRLPERKISNRVLEQVGLRFDAEALGAGATVLALLAHAFGGGG